MWHTANVIAFLVNLGTLLLVLFAKDDGETPRGAVSATVMIFTLNTVILLGNILGA